MADYSISDGVSDFITDASVNILNDSSVTTTYRVKMKEGVNVINLDPISEFLIGINRGLDESISTDYSNDLPCGEYVTMILSNKNYRYNNYEEPIIYNNIGVFFSQFDIVYDPLPEYIAAPDYIIIDNVNFTAPNGLFDNPARWPDFYYWELPDGSYEYTSNFKVGPKIFSDRVMSEVSVYGKTYDKFGNETLADCTGMNIWAPFKHCPNIESIANQGTFKNIELVGACDFTYYDSEGFGKLDAYPSGGAPKYIHRFINADKIRFSEPFPTFETHNLKRVTEHFRAGKVVIDSLGGPQLPFGGISFQGLEMDALILPVVKWEVSLPLQPKEFMNFTFSWSNLGVLAPDSCRDVRNLHMIWSNYSMPEEPIHIATPDFLQQHVHYSWGATLEQFAEESEDFITVDWMPLVPSGINQLSAGHYRRIVIGNENQLTESPKMGSFAMPMKLDGVDYVYQVQTLPAHSNADFQCYSYCANLYSDLELNNDINIPAMPSPVKYARDCYRKTFYNCVGPVTSVVPKNQEPTVLIGWTLSQYGNEPPFYIIADADASYNGDFKEYFDSATSRNIVKRTGWDAAEALNTENWSSFSELINAVKANGIAEVQTRVISNSITLESADWSGIQNAGGWQRDCWFGAGIDPTVVNTLLPLPQNHEWDSYRNALNVYIGRSLGQPLEFWSGRCNIPKLSFLETDRWLDFVIMVSYGTFTIEDLEDYRYNINDITFNGSPRIEHRSSINNLCFTPYYKTTSKQTIIGDSTAFLADHGIDLNNPNDFSTGIGEAITSFVSFVGIPIGLNGYYHYDDEQSADYKKATFNFNTSYISAASRRFGGNDLTKESNPEFYFIEPLWVDSDSMKRGDMIEFTISSQEELTDAQNAINNY